MVDLSVVSCGDVRPQCCHICVVASSDSTVLHRSVTTQICVCENVHYRCACASIMCVCVCVNIFMCFVYGCVHA